MSILSAVARWTTSKTTLSDEVTQAKYALARHRDNPPAGIVDVAVHRKWLTDERELEIAVTAAENALVIATAELASAKAQEAAEDAERKHVAMQREAMTSKKRVSAIQAKIDALLPELEWLAGHQASVDAYNASIRSSGRELIVDAEALVRRLPARVIPAKYREDSGWFHPRTGQRVSITRQGPDGTQIPDETGPWQFETRKVEISSERTEPARSAERLAKALRLVDAAGNVVWGKK